MISPIPSPHVLIIDDDCDVASVLEAALDAVGCTVTVETDANKAEETCRQVRPDLVLMDLMMPGRTGLELIGPLHALCPNAIICIMTGLGDPVAMQRSLEYGAWNVLSKPYSLSDLAELIDLSLRLSASLREEAGAGFAEDHIDLEFTGDHKPSAADLARLIAVAADSGVDPDIAYRRLPLLAAELLDNAHVHGTHGDKGLRYGARLQMAPDALELIVWDDGRGFDGPAKLRQVRFSAPKGKLSGLQLAAALADDLRFTPGKNEMTVIWRKELRTSGVAE
ncbi:MAG: response regulator [bacterium]|nr:response regulator [bacterium]